MAALLMIVKKQKQPKCPSVDEWMNNKYIDMMEYYSAIKKNDTV